MILFLSPLIIIAKTPVVANYLKHCNAMWCMRAKTNPAAAAGEECVCAPPEGSITKFLSDQICSMYAAKRYKVVL
jgi:hypothetical protein